MIEKITIKNLRYKINFDVFFVWFTYFPFIGWVYPFMFRKNDEFAMHHAKQAFVLAVLFTLLPIVITFTMFIIPVGSRAARFAFVIAVYLSHLFYFFLCAHGLLKMKAKSMYEFPVVTRYAKKLNV